MYVCVCKHVQAKGLYQASSTVTLYHIYFLRQGPSLSLENAASAAGCSAGSWDGAVFTSPALGLQGHSSVLFTWLLGIELSHLPMPCRRLQILARVCKCERGGVSHAADRASGEVQVMCPKTAQAAERSAAS